MNTKYTDNLSAEFSEQESVPLFDLFVGQSENGFFCLENDILIYSNAAFAKILDEAKEVICEQHVCSFLSGTNKDAMEEALSALISGEKDLCEFDLLSKTQKKTLTYFSTQLKVRSRQADKVVIVGSSKESVKQFIESDKESMSMFDALYGNIVDGIMIYDYNKEKITDSNPAALKIFGYDTREEFHAQNRFQFVPEYSSMFPGVNFHEATKDHGMRVRDGEAFKTPGAFVKANGEHMIVHATVVPTFRAYGEAFIIFQDSTKRVLAKNKQRLSEKRYREIFDNSHEGIVYIDGNTFTPIVCNEQNLRFFGVDSFEEFAKLKPEDYFADKEIDGQNPGEFYVNRFSEAMKEGRSEAICRIKSKSGEIFRVSAVMICDKSEKKSPKVITFLRDVTNLYDTRLALNEKNEELEKYIAANLQLENFAYFASHDLQTPLRSIVSFTQLLNRSMRDRMTENEREYMNFIIESGKNMRNLINDLLSYSRVNTTDINLEKICVNDLLSQLCIELTALIDEKNVQIIRENLPTKIMADATKLRQVFQNLITNAIKFSREDNQPFIKISCEEKSNHWEFSISDNGIGIHPDFQERIFLLFKRLHNNYEGTGIGLAMVKKIVEQHEGKIWLNSEVGKGSTFYFSIKKG